MTFEKTITAINAARRQIKIALQDATKEQFDLAKAQRAAPSYWSNLNLESSKDKIQSILNTSASPNTDQFYQAVYKYQMGNPRISLKDGILGPETLGAMIKDNPDLAKGFQASQSSDFQGFLEKNKPLAEQQQGGYDLASFKDKIARIESGGKYDIVNPDPKSSATGKYQFVWRIWGRPISEFAGKPVSREQFLSSPKLQEDFMDYYTKKELIPSANILRKRFPEATSNLTPNQLLGLVHFKGPGDAAKILAGLPDPTTRGNLPVQQYLARLV